MNESFEKFFYVLLPFLVIMTFFLITNNNSSNKRVDPNAEFEFVSRLQNQSYYEIEILNKIPELDTKVLSEGQEDGVAVVAGDKIYVHYRGWLAKDGTVFDQSFNRGDSGYSFTAGPTGQVIEGWQEGVLGMTPGEVRRLYIPSDLAYGETGNGPSIAPDSDLIFDVELIRIDK